MYQLVLMMSGIDSVDVTLADSAANISTTKGPDRHRCEWLAISVYSLTRPRKPRNKSDARWSQRVDNSLQAYIPLPMEINMLLTGGVTHG